MHGLLRTACPKKPHPQNLATTKILRVQTRRRASACATSARAREDVESVGKRGKKMLTMKRGKKAKKGKSKKNSYRAFLSKKLKEVKKAHPSWPQSKVFKEAVKGWKSSK